MPENEETRSEPLKSPRLPGGNCSLFCRIPKPENANSSWKAPAKQGGLGSSPYYSHELPYQEARHPCRARLSDRPYAKTQLADTNAGPTPETNHAPATTPKASPLPSFAFIPPKPFPSPPPPHLTPPTCNLLTTIVTLIPPITTPSRPAFAPTGISSAHPSSHPTHQPVSCELTLSPTPSSLSPRRLPLRAPTTLPNHITRSDSHCWLTPHTRRDVRSLIRDRRCAVRC